MRLAASALVDGGGNLNVLQVGGMVWGGKAAAAQTATCKHAAAEMDNGLNPPWPHMACLYCLLQEAVESIVAAFILPARVSCMFYVSARVLLVSNVCIIFIVVGRPSLPFFSYRTSSRCRASSPRWRAAPLGRAWRCTLRVARWGPACCPARPRLTST